MLISQAKSATSLLESVKLQQETACKEAEEYKALFLGKQEVCRQLGRELKEAREELDRLQGNESVRELQKEVRKRLCSKLGKI